MAEAEAVVAEAEAVVAEAVVAEAEAVVAEAVVAEADHEAVVAEAVVAEADHKDEAGLKAQGMAATGRRGVAATAKLKSWL